MEYLTDTLTLKTFDKRIPFDVSFELTRRCNLSCTMCYQPKNECKEMDTRTVKAVIHKLAEARCLFLTFTGGEIFLRDDTIKLIDYATDLGFAVTVKTNGTLLDIAMIKQLIACNVMEVHVSLLGGTAAIHDAITGVSGSFNKACNAIRELRANGITVGIMSVISRKAINSMEAIHLLAQSWNIEHVNFSAIVFPRFPGDKAVSQYRLTDEELRLFYNTIRKLYGSDSSDDEGYDTSTDERLLSCTALQNGITITPDGTILACSSLPIPLGNIINESFERVIFSDQADKIIQGLQLSSTPECASCAERIGCIRCPGMAFMDNGVLCTTPREACRHTDAFKTVVGEYS